MKKLLIVGSLLINATCFGQILEPVKWNFKVKKIADKTYEIHLTPTVQDPWHIYSQTSPEGGALPTNFKFDKNPLITLVGKPKEIGKIKSKYEDVFEVVVRYFEGQASFVQVVKLKSNVRTNVSGTVEFMACNKEQCLPPKTITFSVVLQ